MRAFRLSHHFCGLCTLTATSSAIMKKICVSKNVCHAVNYDQAWHAELGSAIQNLSGDSSQVARRKPLEMIYNAMDSYLQKKPGHCKFIEHLGFHAKGGDMGDQLHKLCLTRFYSILDDCIEFGMRHGLAPLRPNGLASLRSNGAHFAHVDI